MALAGISWGIYSLRGRGASDALAETTGNFVRAAPFAAGVSLLSVPHLQVSAGGACVAILSGALASALGYVAWYASLTGLTATRAASVQLAVPVLAAAGGVVFLAERITPRLVVCAILILGGVALAMFGRDRLIRSRVISRGRVFFS
jgi:drug/metabolite transporter (DMT)-like permease